MGCHLHIYDNTFESVTTVRFRMFDIPADQTRDYISHIYLIRKGFYAFQASGYVLRIASFTSFEDFALRQNLSLWTIKYRYLNIRDFKQAQRSLYIIIPKIPLYLIDFNHHSKISFHRLCRRNGSYYKVPQA